MRAGEASAPNGLQKLASSWDGGEGGGRGLRAVPWGTAGEVVRRLVDGFLVHDDVVGGWPRPGLALDLLFLVPLLLRGDSGLEFVGVGDEVVEPVMA